jgi:hypothetical protein
VLAGRAERTVAVLEYRTEAAVGLGVVVAAADVAETGPGRPVPDLPRARTRSGQAPVRPLLVAHFRPGHADQGELGPEPATGGELAQCREELSLGQVTGRAEDDQRAGRGTPGGVIEGHFVHRSIIALINQS